MSNANPPHERLVDLESALAHLQYDFEQLHSVVLSQQSEIEQLKRDFQQLQDRLEHAGPGAGHDPLDERPPHY